MVPLAARCSHFLVVAQADGAADAFIVPRDAAGVTVAPPKGALGLRALEMAEVAFDNVTVPAAMRLGEGNGADIQRIIDSARVGISVDPGRPQPGRMEYVIPYTKERVVHGVPLAQKQTMAFNIADMHIDIEAMRWMNWRAAWELETRRRPPRRRSSPTPMPVKRRCGSPTTACRRSAAMASSRLIRWSSGTATPARFPSWKAPPASDATPPQRESSHG